MENSKNRIGRVLFFTFFILLNTYSIAQNKVVIKVIDKEVNNAVAFYDKDDYQKAKITLETLISKNDKNAEIQILQNELLILKEEVEQTQHNVQNTRYAKVYTTDIRALIYDMLVCNVPTHSVPSLLHKIGEFTGYQFTEIPHRTTVEQMMRELGVISDLQTAEIAIATKNLTLGLMLLDKRVSM